MLPFYKFLYNCGVRIYYLSIFLTQPFNTKARQWIKGRKKSITPNEQELIKKKKSNTTLWFHCASLGEFEQARPVIEHLSSLDTYFIIVSFFSPSGYQIKKDYQGADIITYLPIDTKTNAKNFIDTLDPDIGIFVKYEFWYHYLNELNNRNIPLLLISAHFQPNQIFFKWYGTLYRIKLAKFEKIFVQDNNSKELLFSIDIKSVKVVGDTRVERVNKISQSAEHIPIIQKFKGKSKLLIAGSSYTTEEKLVHQFYTSASFTDVKFLIVPHEVNTSHIQQIQNLFSKEKSICWSKATKNNIANKQILIIDTVGMLAQTYQYGSICLIGGGFHDGLHNVLEPAAFGLPIIMGPYYERFKEADDLVTQGAAFPINNYKEFKQIIQQLLQDKIFYEEASKTSIKYIKENQGATDKIVRHIKVLT